MTPIALLLSMVSTAEAKDLRGRVGVGFEQQLSGMGALSAKYSFPTSKPQLNAQGQLIVGTDLDPSAANSAFVGVRGLYGVAAEDNMNFQLGVGAGYLNNAGTPTFRLEPVMGAEFFLFGLENLGFTLQWGVQMDFSSAGVGLQTLGSGASLGAHYWF